jgi:hypothetical protein
MWSWRNESHICCTWRDLCNDNERHHFDVDSQARQPQWRLEALDASSCLHLLSTSCGGSITQDAVSLGSLSDHYQLNRKYTAHQHDRK